MLIGGMSSTFLRTLLHRMPHQLVMVWRLLMLLVSPSSHGAPWSAALLVTRPSRAVTSCLPEGGMTQCSQFGGRCGRPTGLLLARQQGAGGFAALGGGDALGLTLGA